MRRILTPIRSVAVLLVATGGAVTACSSDGTSTEAPTIVVTTNILGDVVSAVVGDLAEVEVIMPIGADPHDFAPSARQAEAMENADLLVINGAGFEEGMVDIVESAEQSGTALFSFADQVPLLRSSGTHADDEAPADDEGHLDGRADDPHFWTDPTRMITAVERLESELVAIEGIDAEEIAARADAYLAELAMLDNEMEDTLSTVPDDDRVLVTNHEVFAYFADRFDFEVVGAIVPSLTTSAEPSASEVEELAELISAEGIAAIFADTSGSTRLAEALADSVGSDVQVVLLHSESLGGPGSGAETYVAMMRTNATLVADALT